MNMTCEILEENTKLNGVVEVRVPGIYGKKRTPLPARMSKLVRAAAITAGSCCLQQECAGSSS